MQTQFQYITDFAKQYHEYNQNPVTQPVFSCGARKL